MPGLVLSHQFGQKRNAINLRGRLNPGYLAKGW